eukprot:COSAG04_NODE_30906_length_260_cov_0.614907_1_plen_50_part_00
MNKENKENTENNENEEDEKKTQRMGTSRRGRRRGFGNGPFSSRPWAASS